ncbi:hypothetical protein Tco_1570944 [Tanacetum coccineum]
MASKQFSLGPALQLLTPGTISSGLMQNPPSPTPYVPPTKNVPVAAALRPADPTGTPLSTSINQDAPSFDNDPFRDILTEEPNSQESLSNVQLTNPPFELLSKWTKNHPLENVISNLFNS